MLAAFVLLPALAALPLTANGAGLVGAFALDLARLSGVPVPDVDLSGLDEDGALALVLEHGKEAGACSRGGAVREPAVRAVPGQPPGRCRATSRVPYAGEALLLRAREQPAGRAADPDLGWHGLVDRLSVREVLGDHYSVLSDGVDVLAEYLQEHLGTAPSGTEEVRENGPPTPNV